MLKLPVYLVAAGDPPTDPDAPSTAQIATVVGDFGTGPKVVQIFTNKWLAARLAVALPPNDDGPWTVETLATADEARQAIELTAARHPGWGWTIDDPSIPGDPPGTVTTIDTAQILEALAA